MDKNTELVTNVLNELRREVALNTTDWHTMKKKYGMLFLGKKFNQINSLELRHTLNNYFKIDITDEELNRVLPEACKSLGMNAETMKRVDDLNNPKPYCYVITL